MRNFIRSAIKRLPKLDRYRLESLIEDIVDENDLLEMVLSSLDVGILVADIDNQLIFQNKTAERLLPLKNTDVNQQKIWECIGDLDIALFLKRSIENQEKIVARDFALLHGDFKCVLSCSLLPLVKKGSIQGNLFRIEDITEKKKDQARLDRAERLASFTNMAASVAHEIKNPLGSIGIHVQLIRKAIKNTCSHADTISPYLDVIEEEISRLNGIAVDFLFSVRPMDLKTELEDLNSIIRELIHFMKGELEESRIRIELKLEEHLPRLKLDRRYIKQAFLNIIKNSVEAMPKGGLIKIKTFCHDQQILLRIEDTGNGIPEDLLAKIFEPYFTTKDSGSGLGLTVVYKIIKEHGGDVSVDSREGEFTAFTFSFNIPQTEKRLLGGSL